MTLGSESGILASGMKTIAFAPSQIMWLNIVRLVQVVVICVTIGLFITAIPINS